MMSFELWLAFAITSMLLLAFPGPTVLAVVSYSISAGKRASSCLILAVALGGLTALVLSFIGLGALLQTSAYGFTLLKWAGGLYLLYLGLKQLWQGFSRPASLAELPAVSRKKIFLNTYLVTTLNPKDIVFFIAFVPQFIDPQGNVIQQMWILAATFFVLNCLNATAYTLFAGSIRRFMTSQRAQRRLQLGSGGLLSVAGSWAILSD